MHTQKGMGTPVILAIVVVAVIAIGGAVYTANQPSDGDAMMGEDHMMEGDAMMEDDKMEGEGGNMMKDEGDAMMGEDHMMEDEGGAMSDYQGEVLAGGSSPLLTYNEADLNEVLSSDKLVVLYFYANWCPVCRAEVPHLKGAFDELSGDNVVGFLVHFNDTETTDPEEALAREHGVAYQHTKVFIKNGERVLKAPDSWQTERYLEEIASALGN